MRVKGEIGAEVVQREEIYFGEDKPIKDGEARWYDMIPYEAMNIPFCARPKGKGVRIDFFAFSNLPDKIKEIQEAAPYKFKHTGDVNRNAHYLGTYMLYQMYITRKKFVEEEKIYKETEEAIKAGSKKLFIREQFLRILDQFLQGLLVQKEFEETIAKITNGISDPDLKKWFIDDVKAQLDDDKTYHRIQNKLQMRTARARGISVVGDYID